MDDVGSNSGVLVDELGGFVLVGQNASDPSSRDDDDLRSLVLEETGDFGLFGEIQVRVSAGNEVLISRAMENSHECASNQTGVSCNVDLRVTRQIQTSAKIGGVRGYDKSNMTDGGSLN